MANTTIYPFGTDGELPSSIGLINDLTTGGVDKALSAEQGVVLKNLVQAYEDRLDALEETGGFIAQVSGTKLIISQTSDPLVIVGDLSRTSISAKVNQTQTAVFYLSGRNLEGNITIALSDSTNFALPVTTFAPTNGKVATTAVVVNYTPAAGSASGTTHSTTITVSYGGTAYGTLALTGTVVESSSLVVTPATLALTAVSGEQSSGTITVDGTALDGDVTLTISGSSHMSFSADSIVTTKTVAQADAEAGTEVTVYYTATADDSGTITASGTGVTSVQVTLTGTVATPLAVGSYFYVPISTGGALRYTVLDSTTVSVKGQQYNGSYPTSTAASPLVIPATINDSAAVAVYDSGDNTISASNVTYNVTTIANQGFADNKGRYLVAVTISEGITTIEGNAFDSAKALTAITIPASVTSLGQFAFTSCTALAEVEFLSNVLIDQYTFYRCTSLTKLILNGNNINVNAFNSCTQYAATEGTPPIVINNEETPYNYKYGWAGGFPTNSNSVVYATLYCPNVQGYTEAGWPFASILDINNYTE